jgi:hypothetical protein
MATDFNILIQRSIRGSLQNAVFQPQIEAMREIFPNEGEVVSGDRITEKVQVARATNAGAFDSKQDVNLASGSRTFVKPWWAKVQYHEAIEVFGDDLSNARKRGAEFEQDLVRSELDQGALNLSEVMFNGCWTQMLSDIDSTGTYSGAVLDRTAYPVLASYEEDTDATITVDYMRNCRNAVHLSKNVGPRSNYVWLMNENVNDKFEPLAAALHSWTVQNNGQEKTSMGYTKIADFEGSGYYTIPGLTVGSVIYARRPNVLFTPHRELEIEQVDSGRDSVMFIMRIGMNLNVTMPGWHGKMTQKD